MKHIKLFESFETVLTVEELSNVLSTLGTNEEFIEYANAVYKENYKSFSSEDLTHGFCDHVAFYMCIKYPWNDFKYCGASIRNYSKIHSFIFYEGKYYDAVDVQGVSHPKELQFYKGSDLEGFLFNRLEDYKDNPNAGPFLKQAHFIKSNI